MHSKNLDRLKVKFSFSQQRINFIYLLNPRKIVLFQLYCYCYLYLDTKMGLGPIWLEEFRAFLSEKNLENFKFCPQAFCVGWNLFFWSKRSVYKCEIPRIYRTNEGIPNTLGTASANKEAHLMNSLMSPLHEQKGLQSANFLYNK